MHAKGRAWFEEAYPPFLHPFTTVVGVLVEVPVMLSVCAACNRTQHWFPPAESARA